MKFSAAAVSIQSFFPTTNLHRHSAAFLHHKSSISTSRFPLRSSFSVKMSSSDSRSNQIVEHIVLFKVKPSVDPSAVSAMVNNLNGLSSLDSVLHISVGPVLRCRSDSLTFTHMLHSRYRSKTDLTAYADHPAHVNVVATYVKPIVDDVMAVDWIAEEFAGPATVRPGCAQRLTLLKLKESVEEEGKRAVLEHLRGIKKKLGSVEQATVGENFSPGRAKGFSTCAMEVFKGKEELEASESVSETENKVGELVENTVVLDYAVEAPVAGAANL